MLTNALVQGLYREFNRKWFGNRLPKDMVVSYANLDPIGQGVTHYFKGRPLYIELNHRLRWSESQTALTLLHEMVHVSLPYRFNHGPKFHKEMLRLAKAGAFKAWW